MAKEDTPEIKNQFSDLSQDELMKVATDFKEIAAKQNIDVAKTFGYTEAGVNPTGEAKDAKTIDSKTLETLQKFAESLSGIGQTEEVDSKNSDPNTEKYNALINLQIKNQAIEVQKIDKDFPVEKITSLNCDPEIILTLMSDVAVPLASRQKDAIEEFKAAFSDKKDDEPETTTIESKNSEGGKPAGEAAVAAAMEKFGYKPEA